MRYAGLALGLLLIAAVAGLVLGRRLFPLAPPTRPTEQTVREVKQAIEGAITLEAQALPVFFLYENRIDEVRLSQDGRWATAWLTPLDPETKQVVPSEPGLVLVRWERGRWQVYLPSDVRWAEVLQEAPSDLIAPERKEIWLQQAELRAQALPAGPLRGYRLPFPGGETMILTQSVGHDRYTPSGSAHYAFDFAKPGYPSGMFTVVAAKSGVVRRVRWTQPNNSTVEPGNYIVLEDTSTTPVTYQLYLHLAQDSIPAALRVIGAPVRRGQVIGMADNTGASSGNHLHFMVHTNPASYWGTSVDIVFEDVSINGGRPRIRSDLPYCRSTDVCVATQSTYTSGNFAQADNTPPIGNLTAPPLGTWIGAPTLRIEGWAYDEQSGLYDVRLLANYGDTWRTLAPIFTTASFSYTWDWCAEGVPDGPVSLALRIRDKALNQTKGLPGLTHVAKNFTCPSLPRCVPTADQVALFSEPNFGGSCVTLGVGSYTTPSALGALSGKPVASLRVGGNVRATLFTASNLQGRAETFSAEDNDLSDNRIGVGIISSLLVRSRASAPLVPRLLWPANGATLNAPLSLTLSWQDGGGSSEFRARILRNGVTVKSSPWQSEPYWSVHDLAPGNYTWQVRARNGLWASAWSATRSFTVVAGSAPSGPLSVPYNDPMETAGRWTSSGGWRLTNEVNHTPGGSQAWQYAPAGTTYHTGGPNAGHLTSPPIALPAGETAYLRFWYQYETESPEAHWDQRWVQISVDGGPFVDVLQLSQDPPRFWLSSPVLSLRPYAGKTVQVRFYFVSLDAQANAFRGWFIDDFSITTTPPEDCADDDNSPQQGRELAYGNAIEGVICPQGDVDYYRFRGSQGDRIGAWIEAQSKGSPLDSFLTLLDSDGRSVLARNDDQVLYRRTDSWLTYTLPRDGVYYLKVNAWDHPSAGGAGYNYTLRLVQDSQTPVGMFLYPSPSGKVPLPPFTLRLFAVDGQSGVSHVRFEYHTSDWQNEKWVVLGEDWDGSDGWTFTFSSAQASALYGGAFYARVFDWAGNAMGFGIWNLSPATAFWSPFALAAGE